MIGLIVSSAVFGVIIIFVFLASRYAYKAAFWSGGSASQVKDYFKKDKFSPLEDKISALTKALECDGYEDVYAKAYDGITLHARYYHFKDGAPTHILMHGYKGNPIRSMCGNYKIAKDLDHNVLMVDMRGCRQSEGKAITFGIKERKDALSWAEYIKCRFGTPVFLVGISLGGASVLMANTKELPDYVLGVIADCPFSSPVAILKKVCRDKGMPGLFFPFVTLGAILFAHFNPHSFSARVAVTDAKAPVLIIHGKSDGFVPIEMGEEIYNACTGEKYIFTIENADHALCYMTESEGYENTVCEFVQKCLNK